MIFPSLLRGKDIRRARAKTCSSRGQQLSRERWRSSQAPASKYSPPRPSSPSLTRSSAPTRTSLSSSGTSTSGQWRPGSPTTGPGSASSSGSPMSSSFSSVFSVSLKISLMHNILRKGSNGSSSRVPIASSPRSLECKSCYV